jgi:LPS sulfotransferase NodH
MIKLSSAEYPVTHGGNARTIVLVYHYTRCGSTVLMDAVSQHPGIHALGEIANPDTQYGGEVLGAPASYEGVTSSAISNWLAASISNGIFGDKRITFIEVTEFDFSSGRISGTLRELIFTLGLAFDVRVLHLWRRNIIQRIISSLISSATGLWHIGVGARYAQSSVHLEISSEALMEMAWSDSLLIMKRISLMDSIGALDICYESAIQPGVQIAASRIFEWLRLEDVRVNEKFVKLPEFKHRVSNWSAIEELIVSVGLEDFLIENSED